MKKETLEDIVKITGYSKTTISRVLNGKGKEYRISEDTCEHIIKVAKDINYRPSLVAQFLRKETASVIGLAVPHLNNPFFAQLVSTISIEAKKYNLMVMLYDTQEDASVEKKCLAAMMDYHVDGIIIVPCSEKPDLLELISKSVPVILIDRYFKHSFLPYVSTNNFKGAYDVTQILLNAGHRNISCIRGPEKAVTTQERVRGCKQAIADFGKPCRLRVFGDEFSVQNGYTETKVAMLKEPTPTAIFALSNTILLGAVKALNEQGIRVPEDISLVSFDDNIYLDYLNPPVTRIAQPTENMGVAAIKLLVTCIKEGKQLSSKIFMAPTIVSRDSVKILNARIDIADQEIEIEEEKED